MIYHINKMKDKNHTTISTNAKPQQQLTILNIRLWLNSQQGEHRGNVLQHNNKGHIQAHS